MTPQDEAWAEETRADLHAAIRKAERNQWLVPLLLIGVLPGGAWLWDVPSLTYVDFLIVGILGAIMAEIFSLKAGLLKAELREVLRVTGTLPSPGRSASYAKNLDLDDPGLLDEA